MMIHEITVQVGKYKARKRIGRGHGSGSGKTAGRGHKGARSRAGYSRRPGFEGGQMSFVRRMPKRGFSNADFRTLYHIINLQDIESRIEQGSDVTIESLVKAGLVRDTKRPLKVLGHGEVTKNLQGTFGVAYESGYSRRPGFEGGQMSFVRRMPKRGFSNADFRTLYHIINLQDIESRIEQGSDVTIESLVKAGLVRDTKRPLKVLGHGEVTKKFNITAAKFSASARTKIEAAGGTVNEIIKVKWTRPKKTKVKSVEKKSQ